MRILLLHPGAMGASIGAALVGKGHAVTWVAEGRSAATAHRANEAGIQAVATLAEAVADAEVAISVCPPDAALELAQAVRGAGFARSYVDANAVAPATARQVASVFPGNYVDGGIIGPPAWREGATRLYLAGPSASEIAALFEGTLVDARTVQGNIDAASALKMCYAAFTKGSSALLLAVRALAERNGVTDNLLQEWNISQSGLAARSAATATSTGPKAWRFEGEMHEIAATFAAADLPDGFHQAAAEIYARMAGLKAKGNPDIDTALNAILQSNGP